MRGNPAFFGGISKSGGNGGKGGVGAFSTVSPARHFHSELAPAPVKVAERTLFPYSGRYAVT